MKGFYVEYFFYCRDRPGSMALRMKLAEEHWSFMDAYAERMIARGPTFTDDESTLTGSMHIVDLPDEEAARVFAFEEPNYRAGAYTEVLVRRWRNDLGRTMWDFTGKVEGYGRFLILGHGQPGMTAAQDELAEEQRRYLTAGGYDDRLIACGPLRSDDGSAWAGTAILAELPGCGAAEALLADSPYSRAGLYESTEVHCWDFGGRPQG
jgi:hypothetical protein